MRSVQNESLCMYIVIFLLRIYIYFKKKKLGKKKTNSWPRAFDQVATCSNLRG
jgi:uncharacterized membrane protein